jgi:hypothetical protein
MTVSKVRHLDYDDLLASLTPRYGKGWGGLYWAVGHRKGRRAGWVDPDGYRLIRYKGELIREHNLVWFIFKKSWPDKELDHIDNNPDNNNFFNLRLVERHQNCANQKLQKRRQGKFKGVYKNRDGVSYYAKIKKGGKQYYLGSFKTELEAAEAYNKAAVEMFGEYANLNDINKGSAR